MTEIKRAINWLQQEIAYLKAAPDGNGCPMTEEWQEQIDVFTTCLEALRGMEWHPVSEAPSKSGNYRMSESFEYEVIGNVVDTPELLGGGSDG